MDRRRFIKFYALNHHAAIEMIAARFNLISPLKEEDAKAIGILHIYVSDDDVLSEIFPHPAEQAPGPNYYCAFNHAGSPSGVQIFNFPLFDDDKRIFANDAEAVQAAKALLNQRVAQHYKSDPDRMFVEVAEVWQVADEKTERLVSRLIINNDGPLDNFDTF